MGSRNLSKTAEKRSSSLRTAGVLVRAEMPSTWRADLPSYSRQKIYLTKNGGQICPGAEKKDSKTVDKLKKPKSSGLVNIFTLVLPLVSLWCCCCCLFLWQLTTVRLTMVVAVEAVVARW